MRRISRERLREGPARRRALAVVKMRDGEGCFALARLYEVPISRLREAHAPVTCSGHLDGHEMIQRSVYPGGHLDPANIRMVCRRHHEWLERDTELAHQLGL